MRRSFTALLAGLALFFHPAIVAQTPPKGEAPAKIRVSLLSGVPAIDTATQDDLVKWLSQFQNAVFQMRIRDYLQMVNWDALIEATYSGAAEQPSDAKKLRLKNAMLLTSERMFPIMRPFFLFLDAEIRRIDLTGDKAVIIARTHDEDGVEYKLRWWLLRRGGQWQLTDFENITVNTRFSALMLMGFQAASSQEGMSKEQSAKFIQMGIAIQDGEPDKAYSLIKELEAAGLPAVLSEVFLATKLGVLSQMDDKKEELETALNDLEKIAPTNPVLYLMRAAGSYDASDYKNTIVWTKKIRASVGHDEDSWSMLADSHRELKQDKEYLAAVEGWAADYPNSVAALWILWQGLPEEQRDTRVKPLLEQLTPAEEKLTSFAEYASDEDDVGALKLVLDVMKARKVPKEILEDYQSALQDAMEVQKSALKDQK